MRKISFDETDVNYAATITRITRVDDIKGCDKLKRATVNGFYVLVNEEYRENEIVIFFPLETVICDKFLSSNNLYNMKNYTLNSNGKAVSSLLKEAHEYENSGAYHIARTKKNEAKNMTGFFEKHGRVKILSLRGQHSMGFIVKPKLLENAYHSLKNYKWDEHIGERFNYVGKERLCWKYISSSSEPVQMFSESRIRKMLDKKRKKREDRLKQIKAISRKYFQFHYDTEFLNTGIKEINPDDMITVSVKVDGSSVIMANIPDVSKMDLVDKIMAMFGKNPNDSKYTNVYASRNSIKDKRFNPKVEHFYDVDIWKECNSKYSMYIPKNTIIYGEIVGYQSGTNSFIQEAHDYGCEPGQWKFMPYRMVSVKADGKKHEWNLTEVKRWFDDLVSKHTELKPNYFSPEIVYHGLAKYMYSYIQIDDNWGMNVVAEIQNDRHWLRMEEKEPLCHYMEKEYDEAVKELEMKRKENAPQEELDRLESHVEYVNKCRPPREGIVVRIDDDKTPRAWKLKTADHYSRECKMHDQNISDIEENA